MLPQPRAAARKNPVWVPAAVAGVLLVHAGLLGYSATRHSPTLNEPGHLAAGLSHWKFGRFEPYRVNPPLVRMVAALPVMAVGYEEKWSGFYEIPGARPEFKMGTDFIAANGERSVWLFTVARWACIPFSLIGGLFCFFWARELWGSHWAGLISLTLWCFEPNILAHGELITPDCAAASLGLGAGYSFWRWLQRPVWGRALAAGLLLGLAELTKMTWSILFVLWPFLWLFWLWTRRRHIDRPSRHDPRRSALIQSGQLAGILLLGLYVLNLGYGFDDTLIRLKDYEFISSALTGLDDSGSPGNRFTSSWLSGVPVPLPRQYLLGLDLQKYDLEDYGRLSYLRGEWKDGGWWYYYLYGLGVKTAHGTQLLLLMAVVTVLTGRGLRRPRPTGAGARDLVLLLTPALAVLALVSSQLEFNHHVRYVLPVLGFTFVFIGATALWFRPQEPPQLKG